MDCAAMEPEMQSQSEIWEALATACRVANGSCLSGACGSGAAAGPSATHCTSSGSLADPSAAATARMDPPAILSSASEQSSIPSLKSRRELNLCLCCAMGGAFCVVLLPLKTEVLALGLRGGSAERHGQRRAPRR